jgi:hypothetical protein
LGLAAVPLALLGLLVSLGFLAAARSAPAPALRAATSMQSIGGLPAGRIFLPFAIVRRRDPGAWTSPTPVTHTPTPWATRTPVAGSMTPRATVPAGGTPTPSATPTATQVGTRPATATATVTVSPTAVASTATATVPSPTATVGSPQASPTATSSPTPFFLPRDPALASVAPAGASQAGQSSVVYDETFQLYRFRHVGERTMDLELETSHPDFAKGRLTLRDRVSGRYPLAGAGLYYRTADGALVEPRLFELDWEVSSVEHALIDGAVVISVTEQIQDLPRLKRYTLRPQGMAIAIRAESLDGPGAAELGYYGGFTAGDIEGWSDAVAVRVPYMGMAPVTMVGRRYFTGSLVDVTASQATDLAPRGPELLPGAFTFEIAAFYGPDAGGRVEAVDEQVWFSFSTAIEDLFPVPSGFAAPHRPGLIAKSHAHLDPRGGATFLDAAAWVERMRELGVADLVLHVPLPTDPRSPPPEALPVAPAYGGDEGLRRLAASADLLAVGLAYSSTVESCPGLPNLAWRAGDAPRDDVGEAKAFDEPFRCADDVLAPRLLLGPLAAARVAATDTAALVERGVGAASLDTVAAWNPAWGWPSAPANVLDRAAASERVQPGTAGGAVRAYMALFDRLQRELGPVLADGAYGPWEARYDSLYAGWIDGASRSLSTGVLDNSVPGEDRLIVPDYELRVVRERMVGYGMGPYERYFGAQVQAPLSAAQLDAYRAAELTYAHSPSFWTLGLTATTATPWQNEADILTEHYGLRAVLIRLLERPLAAIEYLGPDDQPRDLSAMLREELPLVGPRLRIRYGNGPLLVWINHGVESWPVRVRNRDLVLPPDGWAVDAPDLFAFSAQLEGRRIDFVQAPDYVLLDGRGADVEVAGATARDLVIRFDDGRVLEEGEDGTMRWR